MPVAELENYIPINSSFATLFLTFIKIAMILICIFYEVLDKSLCYINPNRRDIYLINDIPQPLSIIK